MAIHNQTSSIVNLARVVREGIDSRNVTTSVQTETLKLLLDTLIELGEPNHHAKVGDTARRTVESMIAPPILDPRGLNG
jgi:hypothetical protein